jgi:glycerophosphoryl diester phosphodiesterase
VTPELIGHRGARSLFPENTIAGFRAALAAGVLHFEIDIAMTRDGVLVLSHDPCLSPDLTRGPDGGWITATDLAIHDMDHAQLARFDVGRLRPGSRTARRFSRQTPVDGAGIPTLEEVLRLHSRARWTLEIKTHPNHPNRTAAPEAIAEAMAVVADRAGATKRIVVQSFDWRGPRHLRRLRPDLAYAWLTVRSTRAWRGGQAGLPGTVAAEGGGTWSPHHSELTPRLLDRARAMGLRVVPWTANAPSDIARLARWGVDGIITDDPLVARVVLQPPAPPGAPEPPPHPDPR